MVDEFNSLFIYLFIAVMVLQATKIIPSLALVSKARLMDRH